MATAQETHEYPGELNDVPGWFWPLDQVLFSWFLERQERLDTRGDLLELGAYLGKSAILLGHRLRDGETLTVCDLFGAEPPDAANRAEAAKSYSSLTRQAFERNYLAFHPTLPKIIQAPSSAVADEVAPGTCRFVHIDASHLYEHVEGDIGAAKELLVPDGIVVLDDFRSEHTPGVAVAAWEAVLNRGLRPVCLSSQKLYGTWGDPEPVREELIAALRGRDDIAVTVERAAGHRLVRTRARGKRLRPPSLPSSRHPAPVPAPEAGGTAAAPVPDRSPQARPAARAARPSTPRDRTRRLALDLLPPVVTRAVRRYRAQRRAKAGRTPGTAQSRP
ncbi:MULTISPECIES: class I SAM-dependent methyltransferase [Streptomyces]|uniref:Class I SAM-dependent methyltransferase n=2 Tax=Streptomyces tendae TaxID=1932 RepID=A0A6B3QQA1_STRTE|nr:MULTISPECIES: class I SAM-dependent methyltransferase [Streptomyces]MBQ0965739.1 class I SAM-dependent methyltransferase [Streptomyces sp. RK74B]MBQ1006449.1 class I SAM-dependent methyltransferase [Streptomyces sp. RK23]NEV88244.1 class I SAM-dependent methyltransferase [Streptomyces tendae]BET48090.1 class I SAM-dependent methyltransferase [Kitasatospora aureofaciens]